ncbi:alpha/beta fold hydrolase [Streptomyces sp. NPDC028635]|uniref:thioesterase II family protein n=1 Tax=Streptomyces sp. NPDC028635 TaxID=3154800 RepID=UPI0033E061ED
MSDPWLTAIPRTRSGVRLFLFPHAGGAASAYARWLDLGGGALDVRAVQYPGRESRLRERPPSGLVQLAEQLAHAVAADGGAGAPCAFFGHSMGALVAFETARHLRELGERGPDHLFVAACAAPQLPREPHLSTLPDERLRAWLEHQNPAVAEVLAHPELAALVLPAVRADLTAVEHYRMRPGPVLGCPVTVLTGDQDTVRGTDVTGWKEHTTGEFRHHEFPGGHFFVQPSASTLITLIRDLVTPPGGN